MDNQTKRNFCRIVFFIIYYKINIKFILNNLIKIEKVTKKDILQILEIYNYHINFGLANFEEKEMSYEEFFELYNSIITLNLPFLVAKKDNKIIGFIYLNKFRAKSGYKHTFENSIYIDNQYRGMGIGNNLLIELLEASKKNPNIKNIIAVIGNFDSESSIRIHEKNGFQTIGILKKVGFKKDKWIDAIYMQKVLDEKN